MLDEFAYGLRLGSGAPGLLTIFTGARGIGKTVMLGFSVTTSLHLKSRWTGAPAVRRFCHCLPTAEPDWPSPWMKSTQLTGPGFPSWRQTFSISSGEGLPIGLIFAGLPAASISDVERSFSETFSGAGLTVDSEPARGRRWGGCLYGFRQAAEGSCLGPGSA